MSQPLPSEDKTNLEASVPVEGHVEQGVAATEILPPRRKLSWSNFGGDAFLISLVIHIILALVAIFWVVSVLIESPPEDPTTFSTGAGGGTGGDRARNFEHRIQPKNARSMIKSPNKITVKGVNSSVALPDMPTMSMSAFESGALMGGSSKGMGGGAGGGEGTGIGVGKGGGKNMVSLFGIRGFVGTGLAGTFYDIKQTHDRQPVDLKKGYEDKVGDHAGSPIADSWGYNKVLYNFLQRDWDTSMLDAYFRAPETLTLSQVYIPPMSANGAPKAFNVEEFVKPSRWLALYKGNVIAPKSGRIRFLGFGDDILVTRFNKKVVLDSGFSNPSIDLRFGKGLQHKESERLLGTNDHFVSSQKGMRKLRCGPWIDVIKGRSYPIEILIGETPGSSFWAVLFMEEAQSGSSKPNGKPVLFKVGTAPLPPNTNTNFYNDVDLSGGEWQWTADTRAVNRSKR
ncbi:MAG: hypothetical protein LBV12_10590 [Puniceicoccales bacterium]|jgi:hypothetical protein|nr:hypothetical protein [Puniceicoccales bacterium]